ncbi:hypothetical protein BWQ96_05116 [Gracilariopsis chorda]|uniref:Ubiquitin-like domain-containing protein n=1 Tax=Gracilariopsis chorda TaxID=448386 RepID=A0A2V3ISR5_9FLOR|nr:hypothetical protein BWQ96_05116 [Gracilariopsis chorda]|eukprot:PXF45142.1 hypothetical protein BWQ96_05116 [Gracilariopsis chorda]
MSPLRLRFRFPDGKQVTLSDVSPDETYGALISRVLKDAKLRVEPERVLIAGHPPRVVEASADVEVSTILKSGDSLIVEPPKRTKRTRKRTATQARSASATSARDARGNVSVVTDLTRNAEEIDSGDEWKPDASNAEDDEVIEVELTKPGTGKRRRVAKPNGTAVTGGGVATLDGVKRKRSERKDAGEVLETLVGEDARGLIGAALAQSVEKRVEELDVCGKSFREGLRSALEKRQWEAEGERRYEAWLAKRYEIIDKGGVTFKVRYRALGARAWTEEASMFKVPPELLTEAFRGVLKNREEREKLRVNTMAIVSPRSFWNMVRLFGERVEEELERLVPDGDWSFMGSRRRKLSAKASRNLQQSADVVHID